MRYLAILLAILFAVSLPISAPAQVPARSGQPHPDVFEVAGFGSLQPLNPMTAKVRNQRTASYRLLTMPGCNAGSIPGDLERMNAEAANKIGLNIARNDSVYDFTVRINCGSEQIRICGAVTIFCLGRGFPYNVDVELSDILSSYQPETRLSIPLHEIIGHAISTWNEQYCLGTEPRGNVCYGLTQFTSTPNWVDIMNTGVNSRHGLEAVERERWERTMYLLTIQEPPPCTGETDPYGNVWNPCIGRWVNPAGWTYDPVTMIWYQPNGTAEWGTCNIPDNDCWHIPSGRWIFRGSTLFDPVSGQWFGPPLP